MTQINFSLFFCFNVIYSPALRFKFFLAKIALERENFAVQHSVVMAILGVVAETDALALKMLAGELFLFHFDGHLFDLLILITFFFLLC